VHRGETIDYYQEAMKLLEERKLLPKIDRVKLAQVLREKTGVPEDISR